MSEVTSELVASREPPHCCCDELSVARDALVVLSKEKSCTGESRERLRQRWLFGHSRNATPQHRNTAASAPSSFIPLIPRQMIQDCDAICASVERIALSVYFLRNRMTQRRLPSRVSPVWMQEYSRAASQVSTCVPSTQSRCCY